MSEINKRELDKYITQSPYDEQEEGGITMTWRPKDWGYPYGDSAYISCFDAGADAMLSAVIKWLDEPCKNHPITQVDEDGCPYQHGISHRYLCPSCMAELKGEK